jgi:tRNA-uridine 2-sulfurtransferase
MRYRLLDCGTMAKRERILVAMSGGVDSSVAAARLHAGGFEVVGITLHLWDYSQDPGDRRHGRCCAPEDQYDARRVADALGFAHFTFDRRTLFARSVVEPFIDSYLAGETPSPCTACNRGVKLAELFALANRLGAARVATGHYARIARDADGTPRLSMGADRDKDQSYFLYASPRAWLERLVFPLGDSLKCDVRAEARTLRLHGATKGDSQELCFVGGKSGAYADFIAERAGDRIRPGAMFDEDGRRIASHDGIHRFTVGQRRGLGVTLGKPVFVARIDAKNAAVHVAGEEALLSGGASLGDLTLADGVSLPARARVRIRYKHDGQLGLVTALPEGGAQVLFDEPVRAVSPGQIAVLYDEDRVIGGGRIAATRVESAALAGPAAVGAT